jgi:sugar lactone lactonase YvrE
MRENTMLTISPADLNFIGTDIQRGECILATRSGQLYLPDKRGGVNIVSPDGRTERIVAQGSPMDFMPNGIALLPDRSFLMADLGPGGGVYHMTRDGVIKPHLTQVDGSPLEPTNFVGIDSKSRIWISVSTRKVPREKSMKKNHADGYLILKDQQGARIVAEGLGFTNEAIVDPTGKWLYVNETFARCTSRFRISDDGSLGPKEVFAQYGPGTFPDGLTFDSEGAVWIVSVVSNRVIRTTLNGNQHIILEDADSAALTAVEAAYQDGSFTRQHLDSGGQRRLGNLSGISFGGIDLKTVYLASLFGNQVASFRSPVAGAPPVHWNF